MSDKPTKKSECVICGKPQDPKLKPFCSKRCADVDLNRWFSGRYAIPATEEDEPDDGSRSKP
jgi:hypothetical protein